MKEKIILSDCDFFKYIEGLDLASKTTEHQYIYRAIVDYCSKCIEKKRQPVLEEFLQCFDENWFEFHNHLIGTVDLWYPRVERYIHFMLELRRNCTSFKPLDKSIDVPFANEKINVRAHFCYIVNGEVHICRIKASEPDCSHRGQKIDTKAESNRRLNLLYLAGQSLFPSSKIVAEVHFLTGRTEKTKGFNEQYNYKTDENIVAINATSPVCLDILSNEIVNQANKKLLSSCSRNKKSDCNMKCSHYATCSYCYDKLSSRQVKFTPISEPVKKDEKPTTIVYNNEQQAIIDQRKGFIRVNAGAGTGKTQVIAERGAQLMLDGVKAREILFITFTRKAAEEALERISARALANGVSPNEVKSLTCCTFNGWCQTIIEKAYRILGFTVPPTIIDKVEAMSILRQILDKHGIIQGYDYCNVTLDMKNTKSALFEIYKMISLMKKNCISTAEQIRPFLPERISPEDAGDVASSLESIFNEFNQTLYAKGYIQYEDQLNLVNELIDMFPNIIPKYKHIMVDEFQDSATCC